MKKMKIAAIRVTGATQAIAAIPVTVEIPAIVETQATANEAR
jgi:hypothetical protein